MTASRIRYEITAGNIGGAFAVKNETGAIYVASPLDYETRKFPSGYGHGLVVAVFESDATEYSPCSETGSCVVHVT
ncbi:hypothetical protein TNCV_163421 [Trichonephila clavipes]|nr:hypothetical protein TNCV_163421 [Trichonephila clavipes]